jgi:hypothetical protein
VVVTDLRVVLLVELHPTNHQASRQAVDSVEKQDLVLILVVLD